ncbi:MAG: ribonuclease III [Elusimicrobia bacterium]|nr:ribonuclease III [Elusimicrobiota bacterium]
MYSQLEQKLNHKFKNKKLLEEALAHKSYSVERGFSFHNERLEFLGDSVLGLCAAHYLFSKYPSVSEGELSKIKSKLVSKKSLASFAKIISLEKYVKIGKDARESSISGTDSVLADAFEAVLGALYLDGGWESAFSFAKSFLDIPVYEDEDYKSRLQEISQKNFKTLPVYGIIKTEGPEHEKVFTVSISISGRFIATGTGKSKKEAEQDAAGKALEILKRGKKNDF